MKYFKKTMSAAIMVIAFVSISSNVKAALIDYNFYTTDTQTGLNWWDTNSIQTLGKSYDAVLAATQNASSPLYGWRYATLEEVDQLITNVTGEATYYNQQNVYAPNSLLPMLSLFGLTTGPTTYPNGSIYSSLFAVIGTSAGSTPNTHLRIVAGEINNAGNPTYDYYSNSITTNQFDYISSPEVSSLLVHSSVSSVPTPGTLFLFLPGVLGLFSHINRRKNNYLHGRVL